MKKTAIFEIVSGIVGVAYLAFGAFYSRGSSTLGQYIVLSAVGLVSALSILAGFWLLRGKPYGLGLSRVVQALQVPVLTTPYLAYKMGLGAFLFVGAATIPTDAGIKATTYIEWGLGAGYYFFAGPDPVPLPEEVYSINLVAFWLFMALIRNKHEGNAS